MLVRVKMCAIYSYINNIIQTDCGEVVGAWMQQAKFKVKNRLTFGVFYNFILFHLYLLI